MRLLHTCNYHKSIRYQVIVPAKAPVLSTPVSCARR